ncbi:MAG: iron ABC transporter permease [Hyphomicrobium sp.]|uniref:FecCD family ABC transporter permease n=1 Tax=Hyphomicrobium sp. TaxID=82 RepID=UPI003561449C
MQHIPQVAYRKTVAMVALCVLLAIVAIAAISFGSISIAPGRVFEVLFGLDPRDQTDFARDALVITQIRFPRMLLGAAVGAALAASGAVMQGLFRNPLADPGLIGVSSGAGFAAALAIVLGGQLLPASVNKLPFEILPIAAFVGALTATFMLYVVASRGGRTSMAIMLLAGIAFAALAGAGTGWLSYISDDRQLRDLTFWSMGSLGGATWSKVWVVVPMVLPTLIAIPLLAHGLNAMALGEAEAYHLGVNVNRLKIGAILLVSVAVGAAVACSGLIGFVGIIVPHVLRLSVGANYRFLLPASALLGAALLVGADICARTIVSPSELPIGIIMATIGAPFFIWLLLRRSPEFAI